MREYILKQKPYDHILDISLLTEHSLVFCPFMHSPRGFGPEYMQFTNTQDLREYHINHGYANVSVANIERCIRYFNSLTTNDIIYVPHSSYMNNADKAMAYKIKIVGPSFHDTVNEFSALYHNVNILEYNCQIYVDRSTLNRGPSMLIKHKH